MDKYEYKVRAEEIKTLIAEGEFSEAVVIADTIDWHRVKSVMMLCTVSDLYKINRRFQESKDILLLAYERHPGGRLIVYSLCELSIKMGEFVQAIEYYKEFIQIAPKDTGRYILQYKLYEAQDVSLEERIAVLEEFKKRDYREKWAYELAYLYHRVGLETKCIEDCDEMFVWFGEGRYVLKALELKSLHQPLTEAQQNKYLLLKEEAERQLAGHEEEAEDQSENQMEGSYEEEPYEEGLMEETPYEETSYEEAPYEEAPYQEASYEEDQEAEFRVKTVDVGQYNTINLQEALAESMKELMGDDEPEPQPVQTSDSKIELFTQAIVAPLLQDTADIHQADKLGIYESNQQVHIPQPETATEEVFFEEDIKDLLSEDTKEINLQGSGILNGNPGDTKELNLKRRVIYPSIVPKAASQVPALSAAVQKDKPVSARAQGPRLMTKNSSGGYDQMLSQEYDGQISLVVPDKSDLERQITGQMNITDIMAEWERMKRENEEKRREDVRKRVQQHTGNMFSEFDEAAKALLLEQAEPKQAELKQTEPEQAEPKQAELKQTEPEQAELKQAEPKQTEPEQAELKQTEPGQVSNNQPEPVQTSGQETLSKPVLTDTGILDLEKIILETTEEKLDSSDNAGSAETARREGQENTSSLSKNSQVRSLTDEEKHLFGRFAHNRKTREQIVNAVDNMSMDSYSGNVIVTGEEEAGTLELAKGMVQMLQMSDDNFSGKVAKISGNTFNKKNVQEVLTKLVDGALIIEHATGMTSSTAEDLNKALAKENSGLFVVMEGKRDEMNIFLRKNFSLMDNFNARVDIESLDDQTLVEYGKEYAEELEYSIDELGILALHTRIADMQTSDHEVTVAEVKELVDDAVYFADKKNPRHFFDVLFGKRYDEADMIVLRERDFMHY